MWQKEQKDSGIVNLALLLALATSPTVANLLMSVPVLAQSETETTTFTAPPTVATGTTVRIDGANGLAVFNQNLKQSFEQQFSGSKVEVATNGTEAALKAVQEGTIDIAAIGRGLTPEEKAQGLAQVRLHREKIAIIVGADNPFKGSLTDRQFARIFRGRITNWSQLGGPDTKIRVIDRPENSGTREALSNYPVFRAAKFATGSNATQLTEDNTAEIVKQLGKDGISYARANHVLKLSGVRVLPLHETLPDDPKYPFSQPLVYVHKQNPSPGVAAFLGFALAPQGQQAIEAARVAEAEAIAKGESPELIAANTTPTAEVTPGVNTTPNAETTPEVANSPTATTASNATVTNLTQPSAIATPENPNVVGRDLLWWLLLPVGAIAGSLLWFMRRPSASGETNDLDSVKDAISGSESPVVTDTTEDTTTHLGLNDQQPEKPTPSPIPLPPELEQSPWDMEAPATIVNTSYPPIVEVPQTTTHDEEPKTTDIANENSELPNTAIVISSENDSGMESQEELTAESPENVTPAATIASIWAMIEESEETGEAELPTPDITAILPGLPNVSQNESSHVEAEITSASDLTAEPPQPEAPSMESLVEEPEATTEINVLPEATDANSLVEEPEATTEINGAIEFLPDESEWELDLPPLEEEPSTAPQFTDISEEALNLIADAAEPSDNEILEETEDINLGNLADDAALAAAGIGDWANIYGIQDNAPLEAPEEANTINSPEENLAPVETISADYQNSDEESSIVLRPRNPEWAFVTWYVSLSDQQELNQAGISQLGLRLYDVTEIDLSYQLPHLVEQYECEPGTTDRYVSIPASDRNYMIEIGYVTTDDNWMKIARSSIVHIFNRPYTEGILADALTVDAQSQILFTPRTSKWAYISWQISETRQQMLQNAGISQLTLRLYDVTNIDLSYQKPQMVQQYECEEITHDRYIAIPHSDRDYMVEIGYLEGDRWMTIACSTIVRIFSRPHGDFWFVADAELIIHGATDPGATVNIAGKPITLKSDGTFHLRIPFSEQLIEYLITVSTANGEQTTSIHKKFSQETLEG
ncbi:hypothetical protein Nos7524_2390 [Nostoc sp. PCC 7524]|uniref:DUF4912 domain-containing protein n=1 Tax=Nostoc sp. (strain ATCC 29411 / PCC 7524) TaxID=28072 RepID=UPI00029F33AE|nr:DUF4912 domain-containing protein [Nostoc sp. PCC 7524]AFY48232.1 hypothetical protein Nos7524_2390 [Nostoc sp. PCC 7524]